MTDYRLSRSAEADIEDIYSFTVQTFGASQAERYIDQLHHCAEMAAAFPRIGRVYRSLGGTVFRRYGCGRHTLYYRYEEAGGIIIERVLHDARDADNLL